MAITDCGRSWALALAVLAAAGSGPAVPQSSDAPVFPGATGYGAGATGWRGGDSLRASSRA